ncbi:MAG: glycerophosphodiester phosphodiesterase [bacterium]
MNHSVPLPVHNLICLAHRGASGHEPENTLRAVEKAISLGAPWVEVDVYPVEQELVVIHDERLERTTNGSGRVTEQSLSYLRSLDAGKGERIPLLREVFDLVSGRAGINVELKGKDTAAPVAALIDEYVNNRGWPYEQVIVSSFHHDELRLVKALQPRIRIGALISSIPRDGAGFAEDMEAYSVHVKLKSVTKEFVEDAHQRGLKVFVFTVNAPDDIGRMRAIGVDGVFTDFPELVTGCRDMS